MRATKPFDEVAIRMYREDPALAADMLNACLEDGDAEGFLLVLHHVSNAVELEARHTDETLRGVLGHLGSKE